MRCLTLREKGGTPRNEVAFAESLRRSPGELAETDSGQLYYQVELVRGFTVPFAGKPSGHKPSSYLSSQIGIGEPKTPTLASLSSFA